MTLEFTNNSIVELINFTGGDEMVARAAWVSHIGEESKTKSAEGIGGLINFLHSNHHDSPFEHGQFTFFIHTPIFVAREFHRHRTQSYNEVSGRYSEMKPKFYVPGPDRPTVQSGKIGSYTFIPGAAGDYEVLIDELQKANEEDWARYMRLKDHGFANEVARQSLPLNLMTTFYATVNPRNLMAFLTLRENYQALHEIREVANKMGEFFEETMPLTNAAYRRSLNEWAEFQAWKVREKNARQRNISVVG